MTIKEIRQNTGLTQAAFAAAIGMPKRTLEDWESGKRKPPEYVINLITYYVTTGGIKNENENRNR